MSIAKVKEYLREYGRDCDVQEFPVSSATVELAAKALSVEPARIAKTLSFHGDETNGCILIVTAGDMKIDNAKFKKQFGFKARMLEMCISDSSWADSISTQAPLHLTSPAFSSP